MNLKKIQVLKYDPNWTQLFRVAQKKIKEALQENGIAVHHVGSTAVFGLIAKPKIDVLAVVVNPKQAIAQLESAGIEYRGEYNIPMHYGFRMRGKNNVNLHVYEQGHPEIALNLMFRDYLRAHPNAALAYGNLKQEILKDEKALERNPMNNIAEYTLRKGNFIRDILHKAGYDQLRMIRCGDPYECNMAHKLSSTFSQDTLNDASIAHLALYKGSIVIGYARLNFQGESATLQEISFKTEDVQKSYQSYFLDSIQKWMEALNLKLLKTSL